MYTPNSNIKAKELVFVQILYLYVIPVLLLYYKIIPAQLRFIMLLGVSLLLLGIIRHNKWTYADMGIRKDFMKDILPYTLFTISAAGFIFWLSLIYPHRMMYEWWEDVRFLALFIPISVLQEVIFRGILMNFLRRAFSNPIFIILINTIVFTLLHIIYLNSTFVLPFTFIAGVGFAWMYYQYPNLILISLSHTVLNFTAMVLGFFIVR
jgi:membrane protease YdiL (CAAX protease family)